MISLLEFFGEVVAAGVFEYSNLKDRWENRGVDDVEEYPRCGATSKTGAPPGHTHICNDNRHPTPDIPNGRPHTCECGTQWTGEVELESGQVFEGFRMRSDQLEGVAPSSRRLHDGPAYDPPARSVVQLPPPPVGDSYRVEEKSGETYQVDGITDVIYAPQHVIFARDGKLVLARRGELIDRITPRE